MAALVAMMFVIQHLFTNVQAIECSGDPCVINCDTSNICADLEIHCHRTEARACSIVISGTGTANNSIIYTHQAPVVDLTIYSSAAQYTTIYAHERLGARLNIVAYSEGLRYGKLYAPVGRGSVLSMTCAGSACREMQIYEDWTTEVMLYGTLSYAFLSTVVANLFDDSTLGVSRADANYAGLDVSYRAPVSLTSCNHDYGLNALTYYGHNHGSWLVYAPSFRGCIDCTLYATADTGSPSFDVHLINAAIGTDYLNSYGFANLKLYAGPGANVYAESAAWNGFSGAAIYAREAQSLTVFCHDGGYCTGMVLECPENNNDRSCVVFCDSSSYCTSMDVFTTNGYCVDAAVICESGVGACNLGSNQIFCGYAQSTQYCQISGTNCNDVGATNCDNGYTESTCAAATSTTAISLAGQFSATSTCTDLQTLITASVTTTSVAPTTATAAPSALPSASPSAPPSSAPSLPPSSAPSVSPTRVPSWLPSISPSAPPADSPTLLAVHTVPTDELDEKEVSDDEQKSDDEQSAATEPHALLTEQLEPWMLYGGIGVAVLMILLIGVCIIRSYRKARKAKVDEINLADPDEKSNEVPKQEDQMHTTGMPTTTTCDTDIQPGATATTQQHNQELNMAVMAHAFNALQRRKSSVGSELFAQMPESNMATPRLQDDAMQTQRTAGGDEFGQVGPCAQCGMHTRLKMDDDDQSFYCDLCWSAYAGGITANGEETHRDREESFNEADAYQTTTGGCTKY